MAADLDHVHISCPHGHTRNHREVCLVHLGTHWLEAVDLRVVVTDALLDNEGRIDRVLVPTTVEKNVRLIEWDRTDVANLVGHLDG